MHHRERGAAHINIYYFLVLLIGFFGALWFGYVQLSKVKGAEAAEQAAKVDALKLKIAKKNLEIYVEDITKAIGHPGKWQNPTYDETAWQGEFEADIKSIFGTPTHESIDLVDSRTLPGVSLPGDVKAKLKTVANSYGLADSLADNLSKLLSDLVAQYEGQKQVAADASAKMAQSIKTQNQLNAAFTTANQKAQDDLNTKAADFNKQIEDLKTENNDLNTQVASEQQKFRDQIAAHSREKEKFDAEIQAKNKRLVEISGQAEHLTQVLSMKRPPEMEDGDVIEASMKARRAWINIGRNKMLRPGTKFRITGPNGKKLKGAGTVRRVEQDRAEIVLDSVVAPIASPIVRGDKIWNDLYSPGMVRNIALIGRFSYPYSKPELKILLEKLGNKVHDEVKVGVDLVIVGLRAPSTEGEGGLQPIEDLPGYKTAERLRCEIKTLADIRDLLVIGE